MARLAKLLVSDVLVEHILKTGVAAVVPDEDGLPADARIVDVFYSVGFITLVFESASFEQVEDQTQAPYLKPLVFHQVSADGAIRRVG